MATQAEYLAQFNNLRNQPFWSGFSNDQLKAIVATALFLNMKSEAEYIAEFNNIRNQPFFNNLSTDQIRSMLPNAMMAGSSTVNGSIGDCKSGLQAADHGGWILLNGRPKLSLTATQQAAATSLGIGANLPDASGRAFVQGTVGAQIGSSTILQANLPNVALSVGSVSAGTPVGSVSSDSAGTPSGITSSASAGTPTGSIDTQGNHSHSAQWKLGFTSGNNTSAGSLSTAVPLINAGAWLTIDAAGSHNHNFTGSTMPGHTHSLSMSTLPAHTHNFSASPLPAHTHTVALGGSGSAYTPAGIGVNQFVFLGN
jgi:hypothetical protein